MDGKKLGSNIVRLGIIGIILSIAWWYVFYSKVNEAFGGGSTKMWDQQVLKCMVWNSGPCGFVTGIANAAGELAYQPMALWISAILTIVGYVISNAASESSLVDVKNLVNTNICSKCGIEIPGDAKFCPSCGHSIGENGQGNPGPAIAVTAPTKKMAMWKKILIGIVVVIIAAISAAFYFTSELADRQIAALQGGDMRGALAEPVDRQIAALQRGDMHGAYEETSVAFQQSTSFEDFSKFVQSNPILTKITGHTFSSRKIENGVGYLSGKLTTQGGGVQPVAYRLVKENDTWKILSIDFNPKPDN